MQNTRNKSYNQKVRIIVFLITLFCFNSVLSAKKMFTGNGSGTASDPFQITTAAQLNEVRNNLSANYKLMSDIDLSGWLETNSPSTGWTPISIFTGSFDGNFHVVSGFWTTQTNKDNIALFGQAKGNIVNLGLNLTGAGVSGKSNIGGLVGGIAGNLTVSKCFVSGNITGTSSRTGGLIGGNGTQRNDTVLIRDCYFIGNVLALGDPVGGIIGGGANGNSGNYTLINCYAAGNVTSSLSTGAAGSIVGNWSFTTGAIEPTLNVSGCFALLSTIKGRTGITGRLCGWVKAATQTHFSNNSAYDGMEVYAGATGNEGTLTTISGTATNQNGSNKTLTELSIQNTYSSASWDFSNVWQMGNGTFQFPILKGFSLNLQSSVSLNFKKEEFQIPSIFSDNMILQRNTSVCLWGTAAPNATVSIVTGWNQEQKTVNAASDGNWEAFVKTGDAGRPYNISITSAGVTKTIQNILLGEVWICSGQSNMTMPLSGWGVDLPVEGSAEAIAEATAYSDIRMFIAGRQTSLEKKDNNTGSWQLASANAQGFSAAAYFYALELRKKLGVPVGMVHISWPGSTIQAWISTEVLQLYPEVNLTISGDLTQRTPTVLYNGMLNPISRYIVKGVIWYQGEDNVGQADLYRKLFPAFVRNWRNTLGQGEIPFYYVQLAPYKYQGSTQNLAAQLREAQLQCLDSLNNVQMITTGDLGEELNVHPAKKKEVGQRLAYWSLVKTYGFGEAPYNQIYTPICTQKTVLGSKIILSFNNTDNGLVLQGDPASAFEIAGQNNVYYPAGAQISGNQLEVWSDNVSNPTQVRYLFKNYCPSVLFNRYMIPVSPFRTETLPATSTATEIIKGNNHLICPNPTNGKITLKGNPSGEKFIYNSTGSLMLTSTANDIDISCFPSGFYSLIIEGKPKKIIKL